MAIKQVWVEKFRPRSVSKIILKDDRTRKIFEKFVADGSIPNILLYGGPGTGKTSMSLALIRDLGVNKLDVLKINCSDEKIDAIREKVKGFATTMPVGSFKVVRLEEFDNIGTDAQDLLRDLIEVVQGSCRFIATCNYINKIKPAIRSRFQEFQVSAPSRDDVLVLAAEILEAENVTFDIDDLEKVVAASYPDVRKMIQLLEGGSTSGTLSLTSSETVSDWKLQLLPALEASDLKAARKIVCDSATAQELAEIYTFLHQNLHRVKKFKGYLDDAIVLTNQYQVQHGQVGDVELNVAALFVELDRLTR
jgi:DNA polymerase III delta prime subunit